MEMKLMFWVPDFSEICDFTLQLNRDYHVSYSTLSLDKNFDMEQF